MTHEPLQQIPAVPEIGAATEPRAAPPAPNLVDILVELGHRFRDLGLAPLALAAYRLSLAAHPECGNAERAAGELERGGQTVRPLAAGAGASQMLGFLRSVQGIWPEFPELVNGLGVDLCESGRQRHALAVYAEALAFNPAYMPSLKPLFYRLVKGVEIRRLIASLDQISRRFESFDLGLLFQYGLDEFGQAEKRIRGARERGLPGLLLNTMPKSASMFIAHSLSRSLDAPLVPIAITTATLRDHVVPRWAEALARGGAVCQEHLPADEHNLAALGRAGISKLVVHVRDPRQAMLSNLHHIANNFDEMVTIMRSPPPPDYRAWSILERADWLLESYFPELVRWVERWTAAQRDPGNGIEVLFTTYEDFHADHAAVVRQIVDFHGIAPGDLAAEGGVEKDRATHFRRGSTDEWRETFSSAQQTAMWERMPPDLSERFGWRP